MEFYFSGGVFFSILCMFIAKKQPSHILALDVRPNQNDLMKCLLRLIKPNNDIYSPNSFGTVVSNYKNCIKGNAGDIPLSGETYAADFEKRIDLQSTQVLLDMQSIINAFLLDDADSISRMTRVILDGLSRDKHIPADAAFHCSVFGTTVSKKEVLRATNINLPAFLTGVWFYCVKSGIPNDKGRYALESWLWSKDKAFNHAGSLNHSAGSRITRQINISLEIPNFATDSESTELRVEKSEVINKFGEYLDSLVEMYHLVHIFTSQEVAKDVEEIFVPTMLRKCENNNSKDSPYICEATCDAISAYSNTALIFGSGGMGKSMYMRHLLMNAIREFKYTGEKLPIFVELRFFTSNYATLKDYLYEKTKKIWDYSDEKLLYHLEHFPTIVLLDGLDEMFGDNLSRFIHSLHEFTSRFKRAQVIVSSRGFSDIFWKIKMKKLEIAPLSLAQAEEVIRKLNFRPNNPSVTENFISKLKSDLYVNRNAFATNPLMLVIMLRIYDQYAEVPEKLYLIYERLFDVLANTHDATKDGFRRIMKSGLTTAELKQILQEIGARLYEANVFDFTAPQLERMLLDMDCVKKRSFSVEDLLDDLINSLCLVTPALPDKYAFIHPNFREFFFASFLSKAQDNILIWAGNIMDHRFMREDNSLAMLYDMRKQQVEQVIFLPLLKKMFNECPDCISYIRSAYQAFVYSWGTTLEPTINRPKSEILNFILNYFHWHKELDGEEMDEKESWQFEYETYYWVKDGRNHLKLIEQRDLNRKQKYENTEITTYVSDMSAEQLKEVYCGSPEWAGSLFLIYPESFTPERCKKLVDAIAGPQSPYYAEYWSLREYMEKIEESMEQTSKSPFGQWR